MMKPARLKIDLAEWEATSPLMRSEICRLHRETLDEYTKTKAAALRDATLGEFHKKAEASGTTVAAAMEKYTEMEKLLRTDTDTGLRAIFHNLGINLIDWATVKANGVMPAHPMFWDAALQFVRNGLPASTDEAQWHVGAMANEIEQVLPQCVARDAGGFLMVDYDRLANAVARGDWARAVVKGGLPYPTSGPIAYRYKYKSGVPKDGIPTEIAR